jgi:hypothetical protein
MTLGLARKTGDIITSAGKPLPTAAGKGAILVKRMSEALMLVARPTSTVVIPANAGNQYSRGRSANTDALGYWVARSSRAMTR